MQFNAIATDYDGTLACDGVVDAQTIEALAQFQAAGGSVLLVTGREFADLQQVYPQMMSLDGVVAENGAVFFQPQTNTRHHLGAAPPDTLMAAFAEHNVSPVSCGEVIVSTWQPHGETVKQLIADLNLDYQVILNKRAVMILPKGVNKATGLQYAIAQLGLSAERMAGIGDAENDIDLLQFCGLAIAVDNALPELKAIAHHITTQPRGAGVQELVGWILNNQV
jgi:hydroxymethylpyrimidine pyrophosphatase-like HAD family hydrolase